MNPFQWLNNRKLAVGPGERKRIYSWLEQERVLLVVGGKSLKEQGTLQEIQQGLELAGKSFQIISVEREPSPVLVDWTVEEFRDFNPQAVVALGGGSVLDGAKAIAAMFCHPQNVKRYLEGVGDLNPTGQTLPVIALPTTSGTGSETTKNAVLSEPGEGGFKKSLRHDSFIPQAAILDPELMVSCPEGVSSSAAWDCFTQLLEGFISTHSNPLSDMCARQGLELFLQGYPQVMENPLDLEAREKTALAAYLSGLTLAHAGLGTIHGIAGTLGGLSDVPHGLICSRLISPAYGYLLEEAQRQDKQEILQKFQWLGDQFHGSSLGIPAKGLDGFSQAMDKLPHWLIGSVPDLEEELLERTARESGDKNSPIYSSVEQRKQWLTQAFSI